MVDPVLKKVIFSLFIGVILACTAYGAIITLLVNPYLEDHTWKLISNNFDVYQANSSREKVYLIGNSQIMADVNVTQVAQVLDNASVEIYNLGVNFDTPLQRTIELQRLLQSRPSLVIMGNTFCSLSNLTRYVPEDNLALVSEKITLDDYSRTLFTPGQLELIQYTIPQQYIFKRKFIVPAVQRKLGITIGGRAVVVNESLTYDEKLMIAQNPYDAFLAPVYQDDNEQKKAFLYIAAQLRRNNIPFIYLHMPLDPLRTATITSETRRNYFAFLNETGVPYYDFESTYPMDEFYDLEHLNRYGEEKFSLEMVHLIRGAL